MVLIDRQVLDVGTYLQHWDAQHLLEECPPHICVEKNDVERAKLHGLPVLPELFRPPWRFWVAEGQIMEYGLEMGDSHYRGDPKVRSWHSSRYLRHERCFSVDFLVLLFFLSLGFFFSFLFLLSLTFFKNAPSSWNTIGWVGLDASSSEYKVVSSSWINVR